MYRHSPSLYPPLLHSNKENWGSKVSVQGYHLPLQQELELPASQVLGLFSRMARKFVQLFSALEEEVVGAGLATPTTLDLKPIQEKQVSGLIGGGGGGVM